jgi:hypothetical protein
MIQDLVRCCFRPQQSTNHEAWFQPAFPKSTVSVEIGKDDSRWLQKPEVIVIISSREDLAAHEYLSSNR